MCGSGGVVGTKRCSQLEPCAAGDCSSVTAGRSHSSRNGTKEVADF
jgi:hypothetical protein